MATLKVTNIKNESFAGDQLYLKSNGYLGIGTTNPGEELEVSADAPSIQLLSTNASGRKYGFQSMNDGKFGIYDGTAGVNRIVIASDGKLGIGTASPTSSLHVSVGSSGTNSSAGYNELCIEGADEDIGMCFLSPAANNRTHTIAFGDSNNNNAGKIQYNHSTDDLTISASDNIILMGDNVGIGTSSPNRELHIKGLDVALRLESTSATGRIGTEFYDTSAQKGFFGYPSSSNDKMQIQQNEAAEFSIYVNGADRFIIESDGDVEVGGNLKTNNLSGRNRITNGDMRVSQRYGTTETTINVNAWHYILDRFKMYQNTDGQATVTQVTSGYAASNTGSGNALRIKVTSADTSLSGTQQLQLTQVIEGFNCEDLRFGTSNAKSFTVSFSILATAASAGNVTGTYCVNATNFGNYDRAYVKEYTIDAVDTWKKVTLTFPGCTDGTWGTGNTGGIRLGWFFAGPTSQQGAANQWHSSYKGSTTNQKNGMGVVNNFYFIKDIQVEEGTIATPFERRSYADELARCKRYYQVLVDAAGSATQYSFGNAIGYNSSTIHLVTPLQPEMRTTPSLDYTTGTGYYKAFQNGTSDDFDTWSLVGNSHSRAADLMAGGGVSITAGTAVLLRTGNTASRVAFTAEL
mgnify:CR=1 FL=1